MPELMLSYHHVPMFRIVEIQQYSRDGSERVRSAWQYAAHQPSWIARLALMVFLFVLMLPIVALLLLAFLAAAVVFLGLAIAHAVVRVVRSVLPGTGDGRDNVRVVRRDDFSR